MSELSNPLFNNEREFLERQKEEYKNALIGDVDQIKSQGQEYGKKAAMAGGVLLAGYLLKRMIGGGASKVKSMKAERKRKKKEKKNAIKSMVPSQSHVADRPSSTPIIDADVMQRHVKHVPSSTPVIDYDSLMHEQEDEYTISSERMPHADHGHTLTEAKKKDKTKVKGQKRSKLGKVLTQQAVAFLLIYAGKKLEEYIHSVSENNDIAAKPVVEVTEIETTEYIVPEENAI
ncbi:hypothetical protein DXT99_14435 [Pontibacter diazotrophicus]|uniref:Uncharacterized protein n=1 Tax=Pontibacter diazotrophicus TaxID=1400979 RepID=A0A3D8LBJ1_9BACT|nr:hypothetical protein [Pontibacter diazotrophicus]RDV14322.1 hypothetical protein DXT99_14435 [Pontibacter diazotrophicus]